MKAAEDQVVEDDARFQDDEVGIEMRWFGREFLAIYFRIVMRFSEPKQKVQNKIKNEIKSDKEITFDICKVSHTVHNHTQIHNNGGNHYKDVTSH